MLCCHPQVADETAEVAKMHSDEADSKLAEADSLDDLGGVLLAPRWHSSHDGTLADEVSSKSAHFEIA